MARRSSGWLHLCRVQGVFDVSPALDAAEAGVCLNAPQLDGIAKTLEAAFALRAAARIAPDGGHAGGGSGPFKYPTLAAIAAGIEDEELTTLRAIRGCIKVCRQAPTA